MSQANELLNSLEVTGDETSAVEEHIVIDRNRFIIVPESLKRIAVQYDNNVETVTFDCPRYWDGHDLSELIVYINYRTSKGILGSYIAANVAVDDEDINLMHFDWTISRNVTANAGNISFLVCIKDGGGTVHWNSELCKDMYVSEGLESLSPDDEALDPDIITQTLLLNENILRLNAVTLERASVYVGSDEMPDWADVKIDPAGDVITTDDILYALATAEGRSY